MKNRRFFTALCIVLTAAVLIGAASAFAENADNNIEYNYLSAQECADTLRGLDTYYDNISMKCLQFFMQEKDADVGRYIEYSAAQARDFTEAERKLLDRTVESIENKLDAAGMHLPENKTLSFAKTTMREASGAGGYTHGTTVFLSESRLEAWAENEESYKYTAETVVAHELFHCLTRNNPEFRRAMYSFIGFTVTDADFDIPEYVREQMIANPDVGHHDSYAAFTVNGEKKDCYLVFLSENDFEKPGDSFFEGMYTGLVDIEDGTLYSYTDASDFYTVLGENTDYCEDPEECMATNFSYAVTFGMNGPDGQGYKTPEIIRNIIAYMQNGAETVN